MKKATGFKKKVHLASLRNETKWKSVIFLVTYYT